MANDWLIPNTAIRTAGTVTDANGNEVTIGADCDGVTIDVVIAEHGRVVLRACRLVLGPAERAVFDQLYVAASHKAEAWTAEHSQPAAAPETGLDRVAEAVRKARGGDAPAQFRGFA